MHLVFFKLSFYQTRPIEKEGSVFNLCRFLEINQYFKSNFKSCKGMRFFTDSQFKVFELRFFYRSTDKEKTMLLIYQQNTWYDIWYLNK